MQEAKEQNVFTAPDAHIYTVHTSLSYTCIFLEGGGERERERKKENE